MYIHKKLHIYADIKKNKIMIFEDGVPALVAAFVFHYFAIHSHEERY
jgi:hypothetical protein